MVKWEGPENIKACPPELVILPDNNDAYVIMINSSTRKHILYTMKFSHISQVGLHLWNEIMCVIHVSMWWRAGRGQLSYIQSVECVAGWTIYCFFVLQATESWAGPENKGRWMLLCEENAIFWLDAAPSNQLPYPPLIQFLLSKNLVTKQHLTTSGAELSNEILYSPLKLLYCANSRFIMNLNNQLTKHSSWQKCISLLLRSHPLEGLVTFSWFIGLTAFSGEKFPTAT